MYIGRFAPSPTGPLHFGSLIAAVASYLEAKLHNGQWLVRMEDLDKPREIPGAADGILKTLEAFGLNWDGSIIYQSQRSELYAAGLDTLKNKGLLYACSCSRKEIADSAVHGIDGLVYPGKCRHRSAADKLSNAWRIKTDHTTLGFEDSAQGYVQQNLAQDIGDFVLKRADGVFAYQLAVVMDDAEQNITHIVRGADLLDSTPRQIYLRQQLGYKDIHYAHVPIASNQQGEKLSKQTLAPGLDNKKAGLTLWHALLFLGQEPPLVLADSALEDIWLWAKQNWDLANVPKLRKQTIAYEI